MGDTTNLDSMNDRMDAVDKIISNIPEFQDEEDTDGKVTDPTPAGNAEVPGEPIGEDQQKTKDAGTGEPDANASAIEPPVSWPTDDKEAFKSLPTWAQERIVSRENEREAHFAERSRTIAARERDLNDIQTRATQAQQQYAAELQRVTQLATQLMPAKFNDIQSEADFLRLKVEDPQRASEFEAFQRMVHNAQEQQKQVFQQQLQQRLDNEFSQLQTKFPEFKDPAKATALLDEVRKAAVEYYGFNPQEVAIIDDHRHIPVLRDAISWRKHQANLKAAEGKKLPAAPARSPALRQNGATSSADINADSKNNILARASKETDLRRKAEILAGML